MSLYFRVPHMTSNLFFYSKMVLLPDEGEDMWHTYNIMTEGDRLRATTIRKVQQESATGSSTSSRVRTTITIRIEAITFDTGACVLRYSIYFELFII